MPANDKRVTLSCDKGKFRIETSWVINKKDDLVLKASQSFIYFDTGEALLTDVAQAAKESDLGITAIHVEAQRMLVYVNTAADLHEIYLKLSEAVRLNSDSWQVQFGPIS